MTIAEECSGSPPTDPPSAFGQTVRVMLPLPLASTYDYLVPGGFSLDDGDLVVVPLGGRTLTGVVWGPGSGDVPEAKLRAVSKRLPAPPLPEITRRFVEWVAAYTVQPPGAVLRMAISVPDALFPEAQARGLRRVTPSPDIRISAARARVLALMEDGLARSTVEIAREAACSESVVRGLVVAGALMDTPLADASPAVPDGTRPGPALSPSQQQAADSLRAAVGGGYSVHLLDGMPGSGKTEVYFEAVATALTAGLQVLVLLPEIALGTQWRNRFQARFAAAPGEWHSDLPHRQRRRTWRGVAEGTVPLVVGARSALFLPFPRLGLIVVDEEHDGSFKQEDGVAYHARDMAVVRARLGDIPVVLASATPSLETVINAKAGRYRWVPLAGRHGDVKPPAVQVLDMRKTPPPRGAYLSPPLREALQQTLGRGEQSLLFLNRRGYAPLTLCRACGHQLQCPSCTAWMVEHRLLNRLQCHHCGFIAAIPDRCPVCQAQETLAACGPGVERLAEELSGVLPDARTVLATSDTLTGPRAAADLVARLEARQIDVVIGTQIVAKGYHFPHLTLVGAIDADLGLSGGDLRAAERTFQLLSQVAGRAGRETAGHVMLQTCWPDHPVLSAIAAGDRDGFYAAEEAARRDATMPPFGRLAAVIISGRDESETEGFAQQLRRAVPETPSVRVLGPAPPPLALLRGRHRRRLLVHAPRAFRLSAWVSQWLAHVPAPGSLRLQVDIDPQSFL